LTVARASALACFTKRDERETTMREPTSIITKAIKTTAMFKSGQIDSGVLLQMLDHLGQEAFPNDPNYIAKTLATPWGARMNELAAKDHLIKTMTRNPLGMAPRSSAR
jgi:hypothetical protein